MQINNKSKKNIVRKSCNKNGFVVAEVPKAKAFHKIMYIIPWPSIKGK